jgi:hypothetical protein
VSIIFPAEDSIDPKDAPCTGSVLRAARDLVVLLIPGALDEFELRLDFAPWETPESLLARLENDPGRRPGEPLRFVSLAQAHLSSLAGVTQSQAFAVSA